VLTHCSTRCYPRTSRIPRRDCSHDHSDQRHARLLVAPSSCVERGCLDGCSHKKGAANDTFGIDSSTARFDNEHHRARPGQ
jgi:hypothetical protein